MEEVFDCIDLIQGNEYYIQLVYHKLHDNNFREVTEKYIGIYKLLEDTTNKYNVLNSQDITLTRCYDFINEDNIKIELDCFYNGNNSNIFTIGIDTYCCRCKIYKIHNTEYVLK